MHPFEHFQRFDIENIAQAPTSPGLYAWYGVMVAGPPDWEINLQQGVDHGELNSRRLLRNHTARYRGPDLAVEATGGFSTVWQGLIKDSSNVDLQEMLDLASSSATSNDEDTPAPKLQYTLSSPNARKLLFSALSICNPIFSAPLYIGVAEDLSKRLDQHAKMLFKLWDVYSRDPTQLDKVLSNKKLKGQFAVRAVERGFSPESVEVWTLPLQSLNGENLNNDQLRKIAEALEWLLNRWHRPPLGRR